MTPFAPEPVTSGEHVYRSESTRPGTHRRVRQARIIETPSSGDGGIDLDTAYAVEAEIAKARRAGGHQTVGWKVGYADQAMWRALKLDTLAWAHLYDDTVRYADWNDARLAIGSMIAPKIEPEIVFKLAAAGVERCGGGA